MITKNKAKYQEHRKTNTVFVGGCLAAIILMVMMMLYTWAWWEGALRHRIVDSILGSFALSMGVVGILHELSFRSLRIFPHGLYLPKVPLKKAGRNIFVKFSEVKEAQLKKFVQKGSPLRHLY